MKTALKRSSIILLILASGTLIFILLLFAGDKSTGTLQDLSRSVDNSVAMLEMKMAGGRMREKRSVSLRWFEQYRNNKILLNHPDTIFLGVFDNNTVESYERVIELEDTLKTNLPIIQLYTAWGSKNDQVFPLLRSQAIYDLGSIPMITWEPWLNDFDPEKFPRTESAENINKGGMKAVANGVYDAYIDKWAQDAMDFHSPFFLRLGHEMNDPYRYPWGPPNNTPEDFKAAWRHIVERFNKIGATNVVWIWSPHPAYEGYELYYPGNDVVDWIGIGTLNYGTVAHWSQWWTFEEIFGTCYTDLSALQKPMMITEFGSLDVGGNKATWFSQAMDSLQIKYPVVKALVFFNNSSDQTTTYKALNWYITDDPKVTASIRQSIAGWN